MSMRVITFKTLGFLTKIILLVSVSSISGASELPTGAWVPVTNYILLDDDSTDDGDDSTPPTFSSGAFLERDGLLVVEMESASLASGWSRKSGSGAIGDYIEWLGSNNFGSPGDGLITIKFVISSPGTYRFIWRNSIREGTNATEANDSWLKILADNFYGFRSANNNVVCPRDQAASNRCSGGAPNGTSKEGWFKIYRSGGPAPTWFWRSFTSDNDAHLIFAEFDQAGEYQLQISGRSKHHAIDRLVLFRSRNTDDNVAESFATNSARPESQRVP